MSNTLKFGNGQWATKDGSVLAYNDENDNFKPLPFNFERASSATLVNKDGLIEQVGSGEPRIDYTDSAEGALLLEGQSTNLIDYSEDFSQSYWVNLGAGAGSAAVVTSNYAISPDGTQNASRLQCDLNGGGASSGNQSLIYNDVLVSAGDSTRSIYVKSNDSMLNVYQTKSHINIAILKSHHHIQDHQLTAICKNKKHFLGSVFLRLHFLISF